MANVAFSTDSSSRTDSDREFVRKYKNDAAFARWLLEKGKQGKDSSEYLSAYKRSNKIKRGKALPKREVNLTKFGSKLGEKQKPWLPTFAGEDIPDKNARYLQAVLGLRKGDTVVFGKKRFVLGDFLGAGNVTHIFDLANSRNRVLRLPFHTHWFASRDLNYFLKGYETAYERSRAPHKIKLIEVGEGYIVASQVNGIEDGESFRSKMEGRYNHIDPHIQIKRAKAKKNKSNAVKIERLQEAQRYTAERQLVWDTEKKQWFAVDFE